MNVADRPCVSHAEALELVERHFGVTGVAHDLPSERDQNVRIETDAGAEFVLKIAHPAERESVLDLQNRALGHLAAGGQPDLFPVVVSSRSGASITPVDAAGARHLVRLVTWLPGEPLARRTERPEALLADIGARLAVMDRELASFAHPAMHRTLHWDSKHAFDTIPKHASAITSPARRDLVERLVGDIAGRLVPRLPQLRMGVIHNDVNDHNLLVHGDRDPSVAGIIDFGDMVHTYAVCELANALAYLVIDAGDPARIVEIVAGAYDRVNPLSNAEADALYDFLALRLCLSVTMAARQRGQDPGNAYLGVTENAAWAYLENAPARGRVSPGAAATHHPRALDKLLEARRARLSRTLSVSYRRPLKIVRGAGQFLFDDTGARYLDCVNNVCHVGHCHPRVVAAAQRQIATLNTNTRYLHETIVEYAERLTATLPDPLSVCFFVNSGSEANDLALRLARTQTGAEDVVVLEHAYHGHTRALIDVSPYKFDGRGGRGAPTTTHVGPIPDTYRGRYRFGDDAPGSRYADEVVRILEGLAQRERPLAAFIAESLASCAGQIEYPPGYLERVYRHVRGAGAVCIADEVQVGFGRVGSHMWGFETQGVVPDIVTMGKPIGNGHPLAAVVTTPAVAASFETGMEYFNTFGGNPVSCAIGLAVLDVIEAERLREHAEAVGAHFLAALRALADAHPLIGDVRGRGLFLGVELVRDRATLEPATDEATEVIERAKDRGILLSTDGPYANVIKIKPPMVFTTRDADSVVAALGEVLPEL